MVNCRRVAISTFCIFNRFEEFWQQLYLNLGFSLHNAQFHFFADVFCPFFSFPLMPCQYDDAFSKNPLPCIYLLYRGYSQVRAVSQVNCFDVRHCCWLLVVCIGWNWGFPIQSGFCESVCYFFLILFVSVNCYVSWLVCVAICVSRSHSLN